MLFYKNGRFHISNASFMLPDNCYLNTVEAEGQWEKGLEITDVNETYRITIRGYLDERRGMDFFQILKEADPPFRLICPIVPVLHNGLPGHCAFYESRLFAHCEYVFELDSGDDVNSLHVLAVMHKKNGNIFDVVHGQIWQDLIAGIQNSKNNAI